MITFRKPIKDTSYNNILDFNNFAIDGLYIDIETTGFNRQTDMIYLVGLIYKENNELVLTQFLCEKKVDEYELLFRLNQFVQNHTLLIHFNGNRFDLPFIKARMTLYNIKESLSDLQSIDWYDYIRPYKRLLQTDNLKLSSLEAIASYSRLDQFNGGDLIALYKLYLEGDDHLMYSFILHNEEDMIGLYYMNKYLPLIYHDLSDTLTTNNGPHGSYIPAIYDYENVNVYISNNQWLYSLPFHTQLATYVVSHGNPQGSLSVDAHGLMIALPCSESTKKLYFDNYKEYYYLPDEDTAVHESIANFVSRSHRKKATKDTAYIKKEDIFITCPLKSQLIRSTLHNRLTQEEYLFLESRKDTVSYLQRPFMDKYVVDLLKDLIHSFL